MKNFSAKSHCFKNGITFLLLLSSTMIFAQGEKSGNLSKPVAEIPQYGGTINVGTVYVTLSPLSWDPEDWNWKLNHDTGMYFEQLFAGDLDKSVRKGGKHSFIAESYLPNDAIRGELAESWEWEDPLTLIIHLRHGVMFPDKSGVMKSRELVADDVVFSYNRQDASPKKIPNYFSHIDSVIARDSHTVVFNFNQFNAEWNYRFGYGYYSPIIPRELGEVNVKDWRNAVGSGPFELTKNIQGNSQTYQRNPLYWDTEKLNQVEYPIPFVDRVIYRTIKDEATYITALRTAKIDILETIRWFVVDHLKKTTPELKWNRFLSTLSNFMVMRVDQQPFDDIRVRRAMNLAVNQEEIIALFYGGNAELFANLQHPAFTGYYQPLEEMPESVRELYTYNPTKARKLLAEAGYPNGFSFTMQVSAADTEHVDMAPLLANYFSKVGIEMKIEVLEYGAYLSVMTTRTHGPGYLLRSGLVNPTTSLRKNFFTGQTWNAANFSDPEFDRKMTEIYQTRDDALRQQMVKELTIQVLDAAPYVWLPTSYTYSAWWPWVKNYNGELRAGAVRPAPIYARMWIDQQLKEELGF